jgi:predicted PurR-regulated permease PerM
MSSPPSQDITRITLLVLFIGLLIAGSLWVLLPFLGALIWAIAIVVATWPLLLRARRLARGRRGIAVAVMIGIMLVLFIGPLWLAINLLLEGGNQGIELVRSLARTGLSPPPDWVDDLPLIGTRVGARWRELASAGPQELAERVQPYVLTATQWALRTIGSIGLMVVHLLVTVILAAILYARGESASLGARLFAHRLGGERGDKVLELAAQAVRGVALGVVLTALVQSLLAGLGLWLSGVPRPGFLMALAFALSVAQLGPLLVLVPAIIWLYWAGHPGSATFLLIWTVPVSLLDNFLRPILVHRGLDLPLLLIIAGVIGGLIGFGVIGLFVGPVILAVAYTLLDSWIREDDPGGSAA